jgi:hypothetical protein
MYETPTRSACRRNFLCLTISSDPRVDMILGSLFVKADGSKGSCALGSKARKEAKLKTQQAAEEAALKQQKLSEEREAFQKSKLAKVREAEELKAKAAAAAAEKKKQESVERESQKRRSKHHQEQQQQMPQQEQQRSASHHDVSTDSADPLPTPHHTEMHIASGDGDMISHQQLTIAVISFLLAMAILIWARVMQGPHKDHSSRPRSSMPQSPGLPHMSDMYQDKDQEDTLPSCSRSRPKTRTREVRS